MNALLKSEFAKILTIRSTYVLTAVALLIVGFVSFWVYGYKGQIADPKLLMEVVNVAVVASSTFAAIIAALHITHEYRYNTILYTLTAANSRTKVLLAKFAVIFGFAVGFYLLMLAWALLMTNIGVMVRGGELAVQTFYYADTLWRLSYYGIAIALLGLMFGFLFRHVVATIVIMLFVPNTVEGLLSLALKENAKYLPFNALGQVQMGGPLGPGKAAALFGAYFVAGWLITWWLFLKRDAN